MAGVPLTHGPATAGELADWVGLTARGAITGVIDRGKWSGFTNGSPDHVDRRRVVVTADAELRCSGRYARVGRRRTEYLPTLDEYRLAFAVELLGTAAGLNRDETRRLRQHRGG